LGKVIEKKGLKNFLEANDNETLKGIAVKNRLVEEDQETQSSDLVDFILEEVYQKGTIKILDCFSNYALKRFCEEIQLEVESSSKKRLINALISGSDSGTPVSSRGIKKKSETDKPPLEAGITWLDIYNSYTLEDLRTFFKDRETVPVKGGDKAKQVDKVFEMLNPEETAVKFEDEFVSGETDDSGDHYDGNLEDMSSDDFVPTKEKSPKRKSSKSKKRKRSSSSKQSGKNTPKKKKESKKRKTSEKRKSSKRD